MPIEPAAHDEGLSLVELVVALLISTILLVGVATVLVNALVAQADVTSTSQATTRGQLISSTVEQAMRNARDFKVDGVNGGELWVWTSLGGGRECQGFLLGDGVARMAVGSGALAAPSSWSDWEQDVAQSTSPTRDFFTDTGDSVNYAFDILTDAASVRFEGTAGSRFSATGGANPCWS